MIISQQKVAPHHKLGQMVVFSFQNVDMLLGRGSLEVYTSRLPEVHISILKTEIITPSLEV